MKVYYYEDPYTGRCDPVCPHLEIKSACVGSHYCRILCGGCESVGIEVDSEGRYLGRYVECKKAKLL